MALGETTVTVVGLINSELEFRRVGGEGDELLTFSLRSTERRFDKDKRKWVDGRHLSVRVRCRGRLAVAVHSTLQNGDPVLVTGRMCSAQQSVEDGQPRSLPEVEASAIGPNLMRCTASIHRGKRAPAGATSGHGKWQRQALIDREALTGVAEPVPAA